jgi:hypothetical protein
MFFKVQYKYWFAINFQALSWGFHLSFFKNKQRRYNNVLVEGKKYACVEGFIVVFFYWNSSNTKLLLDFNKNKVVYNGVFVVWHLNLTWLSNSRHLDLTANHIYSNVGLACFSDLKYLNLEDYQVLHEY